MPAYNLYVDRETKHALEKRHTDGLGTVSIAKVIKWMVFSIILPEKDLLNLMRKHRVEVQQVGEVLKRHIGRLDKF